MFLGKPFLQGYTVEGPMQNVLIFGSINIDRILKQLLKPFNGLKDVRFTVRFPQSLDIFGAGTYNELRISCSFKNKQVHKNGLTEKWEIKHFIGMP